MIVNKCPVKIEDWMWLYFPHIVNTGGNKVEKLINSSLANIQTNAPLAMIQMSVESQVVLLINLKKAGLLKVTTP